MSLCRSMEKMDTGELMQRVDDVKNTVKKMSEAKTKAVGFIEKVKNVITSIGDFFRDIIDHFKK